MAVEEGATEEAPASQAADPGLAPKRPGGVATEGVAAAAEAASSRAEEAASGAAGVDGSGVGKVMVGGVPPEVVAKAAAAVVP